MRRRNPDPSKRGVALMLVLMFVVLLTVIVVEFSYDAQVDASLTANQDSRFEATLAAKSAIAQAMGSLAEDVDPESIAELEEQVGITTSGTGGANDPQYDVGRTDYGSADQWAMGLAFEPMNDATRQARVSDEFGTINLNALVWPSMDSDEMTRNEPLIESLRSFFSIRLENEDAAVIVDAIIDWVDYGDDDEEEPEGAEASYYEGLEIPYPCKNGPMDTIEELFLIKGMTPEIYYGDPTLDPPQLPLNEYLTVHGSPNGSVNINSAQEETRMAIMEGFATAGYSFTAELIPPYTSFSQLKQQMQGGNNNNNRNNRNRQDTNGDGVIDQQDQQQGGQQGDVSPFITWSNAFRIYGDGQHGDTLVRIEAYVWRAPWPDDQYLANTLTQEQQQRWEEIMTNAEAGQDAATNEFEPFRILDWKVIQ
jgi:general secretion pathway protein K